MKFERPRGSNPVKCLPCPRAQQANLLACSPHYYSNVERHARFVSTVYII